MAAGVVVLVAGSALAIAKMMNIDPFAKLRAAAQTSGLDLTLGNFKFKAYKDGKEVASGDVEKGQVFKGTRSVDMQGVTNGQITSDEGEKVGFSAPNATYDMNTKDVVAPLGVQITTKDATINAPAMRYDNANQQVKASGTLHGKIQDGRVKGTGLVMDLPAKKVKIGEVEFEGKVSPAQAAGEGKPDDQDATSWKFKAKSYEQTGKDDFLFETGRAESEDSVLYADKITWNRKEDVLVATGHVRYFGTEANLIADQVTVRRKENRAVFDGGVTMLMKPEDDTSVHEQDVTALPKTTPENAGPTRKPAAKGDPDRPDDEALRDQATMRQYPALVRADSIDYRYKKGERRAEITGSPYARQELTGGRWRSVWADSAHYDGESKRLTMKSASGKAVRVRNSLGDDMKAIEATLSTKKGEDYMKSVEPEGRMLLDNDDVPGKEKGGG